MCVCPIGEGGTDLGVPTPQLDTQNSSPHIYSDSFGTENRWRVEATEHSLRLRLCSYVSFPSLLQVEQETKVGSAGETHEI